MSNPLTSPKLFMGFWLDAFKEAFGKGWAASGVMSLLIPDLVIVIGKVRPLAHLTFVAWVSENPNLARLYCVAVVVLAYLIYAPYRKYKETQIHAFGQMKKAYDRLGVVVEERDKLKAQLNAEKTALKEQRRRKEFAEKLALLMDNGRELASRFREVGATSFPTDEEIDDWSTSVYVELGMHTSSTIYIARFNAAEMSGNVFVGVPIEVSNNYNWIMSKVKTLGEFIKELAQSS
jgi:hypothetical protein